MKTTSVTLILFSILFTACSTTNGQDEKKYKIEDKKAFDSYWYASKAELASYKLEQARYGEIHKGHSVLIFVTEDFSKSKHVKLNNPQAAGKDKAPILKLNATRKFNTGLYPYSTMVSVFTPVDMTSSLKLTMSGQEWCGHVFSSYDLSGSKYKVQSFSYFEEEGEKKFSAEGDLLEDEIMNRIRLNPESLPKGAKMIIPASTYMRLLHVETKAYKAECSFIELKDDSRRKYSVTYPELDRSIVIEFENKFPYKILGWEETYYSGWGESKKKLTTKATLNKILNTDYWTKNKVVDGKLRKELGLEE